MDRQDANSRSSTIVLWELTKACRLNCLHCAIGAAARRSPLELSTYEAYKTIDQIAAIEPAELTITGGDVFERADVFQLVDYARRRGISPTITISPTPAVTGAAIGKLRQSGAARIAIAIDSAVPERHDAVRGVPGQFGSTLMAMRWAKTAGLPIEVNTLVSRRNRAELRTIAELIAGIGVATWNLYFLVPSGSARHMEMLAPEDAETVYEMVYYLGRKNGFAIRTFEAPEYRRFLIEKKVAASRASIDRFFASADCAIEEDLRSASIAAHELIFISHTGEVSVSPFVPLTAGNVRYQPLSLIHRSGELFAALRDVKNLKGRCGRCEFASICGGSRARAYATTGDLLGSDPMCGYQPGTFAPGATHGAAVV